MGSPITRLLRRLDGAGFWNVQVWEFGFRSLPRGYAWLFFLRAVLAHPVKAARGMRRYRGFIRRRVDISAGLSSPLAIPDEEVFLRGIQTQEPRPLVGLGFCLKPYDPNDPSASCPSGRANHDCLYLERGEVRPVCADCAIHHLGSRCLAGGCPVYIMTSAKDIARDFLFPQVGRSSFPSAILLLCPYSVRAIILPLFICGVDTLLLVYARGSCADYGQWLKADRGIKEERTMLNGESEEKLLGLLEKLGAGEWKEGGKRKDRRFVRGGNIFYPD
ncbi:MAG TPA: hypothetical protein VMW46_12845 [Candidatus Desulfaltia sp.]|nr:hypothetical protein [Candidatus Desulfaltia sp.]